jgi:hypothetical protein
MPTPFRCVWFAFMLGTLAPAAAGASPASPQAPPVSRGDSMRGQFGAAVDVAVDRTLWPDLEESLRAMVTQRLNALGIKVLPGAAYPKLLVRVRNVDGILTNGEWQRDTIKIFSIRLQYVQLLPLPGGGRLAEAATWDDDNVGFAGIAAARGLARDALFDMLEAFERDWVTANPLPPSTTAANRVKPAAATYTPEVKGNLYRYVDVPESFVPPIPQFQGCCGYVRMPGKREAGSLIEIAVRPVDPSTIDIAAGIAMYRDLQDGPYWQTLLDDIAAVQGYPGILYCEYLTEPRSSRETPASAGYYYWFKERPATADPARLKKRIPNHPLAAFRTAVETCPADGGTARRIR